MPMEVKDYKYGIPNLKKFPMPDARHVRSAIKFFNYAPPRYRKQLAAAIMKRMKEYGLTFDDFTVGKENRFSDYIPMSVLQHRAIKGDKMWEFHTYNELYHHGILGQKWGKKNGPPYPLAAGDHSAAEKKAGWKSSLKKAKKDYKTSKANYRQAKANYEDAKYDRNIAKRELSFANADYKNQKSVVKDSKAAFKDRKKFGSPEEVSEAKRNHKESRYDLDKAELKVEKAIRELNKANQSLAEAANNIDLAKQEMKAKKAMLKLEKKQAKDIKSGKALVDEMEDMYAEELDSAAIKRINKRSFGDRREIRDSLQNNAVDAARKGDYDEAAVLMVKRYQIRDFDDTTKTPRELSMMLKYRESINMRDYVANFDLEPTGNKKADKETQFLVREEIRENAKWAGIAKAIDKIYGPSKQFGKKNAYTKDCADFINRQKSYIYEKCFADRATNEIQKKNFDVYINSLKNAGFTYSEIADKLGVSTSTIADALN